MGLIGIVTVGIMAGSNLLFKVEGETSRILDAGKVVSGLIETIRADPVLYQANFSPPTVTDNELLNVNQLPLALRPGYFGPADQCPECRVRIGFVLRPLAGQMGLFKLVVRSYETDTQVVKDMYAIVSSF